MCQCADVTWETANLTSPDSSRSNAPLGVQDIRELALMLKRDLTGSR
jgi:hypothetical protein